MVEEVEVISTVRLSSASHSEIQMMSSGNFLVEGTHFHLTSLKTHLMTFLGAKGLSKEIEAEVQARFSLLSVDFLPLKVGFLLLIQDSVRLGH